MNFETAFRKVLVDRAAVTAICGERIRYGEHKPEAAALPDLYFDVANSPNRSAYGGLGDETLRELRVEVVARSLDPNHVLAACRVVSDFINDLNGISVTVGAETGKPFEAVFLDDSGSDLPDDEITINGTSRVIYRASVLLTVMFRSTGYAV